MAALFNYGASPTLRPLDNLDIGYCGIGLKCIKGSTMDLLISDMAAAKEDDSSLLCDYCDPKVVRNTAELLLRGVATACVRIFSGDMSKIPYSAIADVKKEIVAHLIEKVGSFVSGSITGGEDGSDESIKAPISSTELISGFIDSYVRSKGSLVTGISWSLFNKYYQSKIEDSVQKMVKDKFWSRQRRENIADILLKETATTCLFHCPERTSELSEHSSRCKFRQLSCPNAECRVSFPAVHTEKHDSICPLKVVSCRQMCKQLVIRRDMDKHCTTVCKMKRITCPFQYIGCKKAFPQCTLQEHCLEFLHSHTCYMIQANKIENSLVRDLNRRVELLEEARIVSTRFGRRQVGEIRRLEEAIKAQQDKIHKVYQEFNYFGGTKVMIGLQ